MSEAADEGNLSNTDSSAQEAEQVLTDADGNVVEPENEEETSDEE